MVASHVGGFSVLFTLGVELGSRVGGGHRGLSLGCGVEIAWSSRFVWQRVERVHLELAHGHGRP